MFDGVCRPWRRLFSLAVICLAAHSFAQQPARTTISDVIYRADSTPAQGTLIISWPGFTLPNGQAIAGGDTSTTLGPGGTLSVALVPNAGAIPANTVYTVVYQLDERIAAINTESRIRTEVQLGELREGQADIKRMLQAHQDETMGLLRKK